MADNNADNHSLNNTVEMVTADNASPHNIVDMLTDDNAAVPLADDYLYIAAPTSQNSGEMMIIDESRHSKDEGEKLLNNGDEVTGCEELQLVRPSIRFATSLNIANLIMHI